MYKTKLNRRNFLGPLQALKEQHQIKVEQEIETQRGIHKKIASKMNGASGAESKAVCTEAGMFALRERRVHVTQEDFEMAVSKVMQKDSEKNISVKKLFS